MAESVMIDVDSFLQQCGVEHTRYVDDIRMFADSESALLQALEKLTLYLYENHRLTLATDKTKIMSSSDFVENHLHNPYLDTKDELMEELDNISPYGEGEELDEGADESEEDIGERLVEALEQVLTFDYIDLGLTRSIVRTARRNGLPDLIPTLLDNFSFFAPVCPDIFLYLQEVANDWTLMIIRGGLEGVVDENVARSALVRHWIEHFIAGHVELLASQKLKAFVLGSHSIESKARAAVTLQDLAWVRAHKAQIGNVGPRAKRAIINAARVLPRDERTHWLEMVAQNTAVPLEKWLAQWVKATA